MPFCIDILLFYDSVTIRNEKFLVFRTVRLEGCDRLITKRYRIWCPFCISEFSGIAIFKGTFLVLNP